MRNSDRASMAVVKLRDIDLKKKIMEKKKIKGEEGKNRG